MKSMEELKKNIWGNITATALMWSSPQLFTLYNSDFNLGKCRYIYYSQVILQITIFAFLQNQLYTIYLRKYKQWHNFYSIINIKLLNMRQTLVTKYNIYFITVTRFKTNKMFLLKVLSEQNYFFNKQYWIQGWTLRFFPPWLKAL